MSKRPEQVKVGDIVLFVMPDTEWRPAIVVERWGSGLVNLQVFTDGLNDRRVVSGEESTAYNDAVEQGLLWRTSVPYEEGERNVNSTWHFREGDNAPDFD